MIQIIGNIFPIVKKKVKKRKYISTIIITIYKWG